MTMEGLITKSYLAPISAFILFSVLAIPAAFSAPPLESLTVTLQGDGDGRVESDPEGIDCPGDCDESYKKNSTVVLTATADPNSSFVGWQNACGDSDPTCEIKLSATTDVIASFEAEATQQLLPATGQTLCWDINGSSIPCAGSGQDGEIQAGATLSYTDNGDGTITDNNTQLMWEKKDASGGIHDKDDTYTWDDAFSDFIDDLNNTCNGEGMTVCTADNQCGAGAVCGFAGHTDWRVPNIKELISIVNYGARAPAVSEAFNIGCTPGCLLTTCSCTPAEGGTFYWSSTSYGNPSWAWRLGVYNGGLNANDKGSNFFRVRAVRGGL